MRVSNIKKVPSVARPGRSAGSVLAYAILTFIGILFLVPFLWLFLSSVNPSASLAVSLPKHPSLSNFSDVLTSNTTLQPFANGLILSGGTGVLTMFAAALAAYPLSRYNLRFKRPFMYTILFATGLPVTAILVPVYALFVQINLLDSFAGTILFMTATSLPFAIWLTKNFMDSVPLELEEAAWVDGASALRSLRSVVLPLMLPGLSVVGIFTFILAWGNFFVPFILLLSPNKQPAAVSIYQFFGQYGTVAYGQLAAYSILYSAPVVALYVFISRFLGGAFNLAGAVKG
ncbi:MAG: carbohydrate ABC transporter permease [Rubrobacteraceae bacterium]|nr:carbohydrate ABC transporter permease [Rubrobacteraceae bacterium]